MDLSLLVFQLLAFQFILFPVASVLLRFSAGFTIPALPHDVRRRADTTGWMRRDGRRARGWARGAIVNAAITHRSCGTCNAYHI